MEGARLAAAEFTPTLRAKLEARGATPESCEEVVAAHAAAGGCVNCEMLLAALHVCALYTDGECAERLAARWSDARSPESWRAPHKTRARKDALPQDTLRKKTSRGVRVCVLVSRACVC